MARTGISFTSGIGDLIVGGTQGSVLFIGPGGTLAQDNANFFWNDTLNILRLGSGTTTFTNTGSSGGVMSTMAAGNTFFIPFTGQNTSAGTTASTDIVLGNDLATDLTNYTDWGISSSTNADPLYTAFGAGFAYWYNQSGGMALGTANNFPVHIFSGGTLTANIRMTVLGTGNVGIGTTAPGFKLEVFGDMAVNNSANVNLRILRSSVEYGNIFNLLTGSAQGNNTDLNIRATNAAGGLNFMVGGSNTKMRLDFNGNLMIGTSPATDTIGSLLEVYTPNAGTTVTSFQNPTITVLNSDTTNNNYSSLAFRSLDAVGARFTGARISGVFTSHTAGAGSGEMAFLTQNAGTIAERMRLTAAGNLGLGTSTFGTSATATLALFNGTEPSTSPADTVQLFSVDISAGNASLGIRTETAVVSETVVSDRTLAVKINATVYKICLKV